MTSPLGSLCTDRTTERSMLPACSTRVYEFRSNGWEPHVGRQGSTSFPIQPTSIPRPISPKKKKKPLALGIPLLHRCNLPYGEFLAYCDVTRTFGHGKFLLSLHVQLHAWCTLRNCLHIKLTALPISMSSLDVFAGWLGGEVFGSAQGFERGRYHHPALVSLQTNFLGWARYLVVGGCDENAHRGL